jgi:DNA polymerase-3 subunit delta'
MVWQGIHQHDHVVERFRRDLGRGRLASTFLFLGPPGIGKRTLGVALAKAMLCETSPEAVLDPCGRCAACVQVDAGSHPDLLMAGLPEGKSTIPLELLIGPKEKRNKEGLCHDLSLKPMRGGRKIAIIDDADYFSDESANCLLKVLEEPPPRSVIILVASKSERVLPTIRSRSQVVRCAPLPCDTVARLLLERDMVESREQARRVAELTGGSLRRAVELADPELLDWRRTLYEAFASADMDIADLSQSLFSYVDDAGKDAAPRRTRLRLVLDFAVDFFRQIMRGLAARPIAGDTVLRENAARACRLWPAGAVTAAACIERTIDAAAQVDANANLATLVFNWTEDVGTLVREGRVTPPENPVPL